MILPGNDLQSKPLGEDICLRLEEDEQQQLWTLQKRWHIPITKPNPITADIWHQGKHGANITKAESVRLEYSPTVCYSRKSENQVENGLECSTVENDPNLCQTLVEILPTFTIFIDILLNL